MKLVMDLSYENIWRCWRLFRKGKKKSRELKEKVCLELLKGRRVNKKLNPGNFAGYYGMIMKNEPMQYRKEWNWLCEIA